jgi:N-acetylmuramoyl-L-alanine amidase
VSRIIRSIVVHCSASPDWQDIGRKEIRDWHVNGNKWSDIGYHYVIRRDGTIEAGRDVSRPGAHAAGRNHDTIAICWVGTDQITPSQEKSLFGLLNWLRGVYNLPTDQVLGHREVVQTSKTCPNLDMNRVRAELVFIQPIPKVRQ